MVAVRRLVPGDEAIGCAMFAMMKEVFEEDSEDGGNPLRVDDAKQLLSRADFWALVATESGNVVGGLTAHALPMTRSRATELFIYDLAVKTDRQRQGIGRKLVTKLLSLARAAGIETTFVPADNEDTHALDFYRALGGTASPVTFFTFQH